MGVGGRGKEEREWRREVGWSGVEKGTVGEGKGWKGV